MAYGTKYTASFESTAEETYDVFILEKDYVGSEIPITLSAVPVRHSWATDEPQPPIKGSSLTLSILNTGSLPISSFYSNNDDQFKIWFYKGANKLFEGFLVQDDCTELMVDYVHEIVLSFTDNLGLLKDVALDKDVPDFGGYPCTAYFDFVSVVPDNFIYLYNTDFIPVVSTPFTISGHIEAAANAAWTPIAVTSLGGNNWKVQVVDGAFTDMQAWPCIISGSATINLYNRNTLLNIIRVCLANTGLALDSHIYANIFELSNDDSRAFLEQTYIDPQTFIDDENFKNCYEVLEIILGRFGLTLFQANGVWNIIRWHEFRYYTSPYPVDYFIYNSAMEYTGAGTMNNLLVTGFEEAIYPENGLTRSIIRPWQFETEKFDYEQPKYLLRNFDLQDLGALITSYTSGANTNYEYEFTGWQTNGVYSPYPDIFIRVVRVTATNEEIERYAVIDGQSGAPGLAAESFPLEVATGDKLTFEFTYRTNTSQPGAATTYIGVRLFDGTTTLYADKDPNVNWDTGLINWPFTIPVGANNNENQNVVVETGAIPFDGLVFLYLPQVTTSPSPGDETQIKDIRLTYTPFINDSTKIIGQTHKSLSDEVSVKNTQSIEVLTDDSPRNSIAGTLYKPSFTSLVQDRTSLWYRIQASAEEKRIGEIISTESLVIRLIPRAKLEGTFYGLTGVSMLAILTNNALPTYNFIFGSLEIDYRNNSFTGTQYEMYIDDEIDIPRPGVTYEFKYLYSNV